ncbi:MAG: hypothetical protein EZS28_021471 [Streblomastix strix]|uniref:RRM domain-containing protein n=1 Tax=Streblomastix strix TaxID=222440 RepID=A0A5J4VKJ3_9EUKA|nr:MAG: hypothetical protein EZS28_021471 [Streblomastix strix]
MQLTIKDLSGKVIFVEISDFNETVEIVKLRVFQKEFISPDVQHLVYKSHILKDKCKLLSYGIMEGCPINLVVRPVPNEINDSSKSLPQDDNPAQIFVYSLNSCTTEQQLKKYFSKAGHVLSIYIPTSNGQKRGFAFITLKDKKDIPKALETIRQKLLIGCQLRGVVIQNSIDFIGPGNNDLLLIDQIFDSQSTTDDEKAEQLKLLFQKFFKLNDYKQLVNLNYEAFYMINSHLKDCQTAPELVLDLLYSNHDNSCQAMIETPNLISSMVKIYDYKLNEIINQDQEREGKYIRETISQCFREIKYYGNKSSQEQLCDAGFIAYMTKAISTAGGCSQYNDGIIIWSLSNIDIFLYYLLFGRKAVNAHETEKPPLPHLAVGQKESFEEEGGDEEVDSQIFNINKGHSDNPQKFAKSARIEILHVFVDRKNRKFR